MVFFLLFYEVLQVNELPIEFHLWDRNILILH